MINSEVAERSIDDSSGEQSRPILPDDQPHPALNRIQPPGRNSQSMAPNRQPERINLSQNNYNFFDLDSHLDRFNSVEEQLEETKRLFYDICEKYVQMSSSCQKLKKANKSLINSMSELEEAHE